jgi:hypothetical protein
MSAIIGRYFFSSISPVGDIDMAHGVKKCCRRNSWRTPDVRIDATPLEVFPQIVVGIARNQ